MTPHTPGPWKVVEHYEDASTRKIGLHGCPAIVSEKGVVVVHPEVGIVTEDLSTAKANARLIAAAPEMLEALKECLEEITNPEEETWPHAQHVAKRAIAKAEGRG
jgi:hypothetical protein